MAPGPTTAPTQSNPGQANPAGAGPAQPVIATAHSSGTLAGVIRNFILDWSGTLVDDLPAVWQATNYVLERAGKSPLTMAEFQDAFVLPFTEFYDRFTPGVPMHQLEHWFHEAFTKYQHLVRPLPFAHEFLDFCRQHRLRTYLLSAVRQDYFSEQLRRAGFTHRFDGLYLAVLDKRNRIIELIEHHQLLRAETVFVGDMCHDIECARLGGIWSCAVLTGYNSRAKLQTSAPDLIVSNLGELMDLLRQSRFEWPWARHSGPCAEPMAARPETTS